MPLHFGLLGPLTVSRDGRPVALGSTKQQLVLAALLLRPGVAISANELTAMVWGGQPPASAAANLRAYLRGLRQALGDGTGVDRRIRTTTGGYLLRVEPGERDLDRFDVAATRGRAALAAGDPETAHTELAAALGMWRGPALAGLPLPRLLAGRVARMEERRLLAEEDHAAARLALGAAAQVIPRLRALLDRHPLRQRAWAQLMTGLYQIGDVAGALAAFQQARRSLAEQTGMDPGPELLRLHDDILHHRLGQQPATTGLADEAQPRTTARPQQLPLALPGFVGRTEELAVLDAALGVRPERPGTVDIVTISGMAGVGKTTLALHWAHRAVDRFPDGQLYVNLRGYDDADAVSPADALVDFLDALGAPIGRIPSSVDARAALYRSLLASRRMLVVLDNSRDAEQVRPLLPGAGQCAVLVTSRDQLSSLTVAQGARPVTLEVLTAAESTRLLRSRLGDDRVAAEPEATTEMIESTGRLPLALSIVAARLTARPTFPIEAVAAQLRPSESRLELLADGDVRRVFSWSYRALSTEAARLLRLLGLHPGPDLTADAAAVLLGRPRAAVTPLLQELTRLHLLTEHLPERFALHDLLRSYAAELAQASDRAEERQAAARRMYDHYLHSAHPGAMLLQPTWTPIDTEPPLPTNVHVPMPDRVAAAAWFHAEHPVLLRVLRQAAETGFERYAWQLAWALAAYLAPRGMFQEQLAAQQAALAAAQRSGDANAQAQAHRMLARALMRLGDQEAAEHHVQRALELYEQLDDLDSLALILRQYTEHCTQYGRLDEALKHSVEALRVSRLVGNRYAEARALNVKGYLHALTGDYHQAVVDCAEALAEQEAIDDRVGQAATLDSLGFAYHRLGDPARAAVCYEQSVKRFQESANTYHEGLTLIRLGEAREAMADPPAAARAWQRAIRIYDDLGDPAADEVRQLLARVDPAS
ncbi:BTAD domain-containing putative transcriptional regulator [Micromonospora sp. WMMD1155]|uniref:AfsR/SARP family transcriptional regulator n=1 Tax=Micromonospora sp. WMMD1155 TaxID=3016094 RepID=UPI00249BEB89|nr:BTAD domain-containing putative transcriptional regulator [Micromonospora sp. WMMD1155]WFE53472.1 BTAD domain-containing putative transcriptional regulator [Micromonospora sp. WMMD1155]